MKKLVFLILLISLTFSWEIQLPEAVEFGGQPYGSNYVVFASKTTLYLVNVHNGKFLFINLGKITGQPVVVDKDIFIPTGHSITRVYYTSSLQKVSLPVQLPPSMADEELNITGLYYIGANKFVLNDTKMYVVEYRKGESAFSIVDEVEEKGDVVLTKRGSFLLVNARGIYFYDLKKYIEINSVTDVLTTQNAIYVGDGLGNIYKVTYDGRISRVLFLGGSVNAIYDSLVSLVVSTTKGTFKVDKNIQDFMKLDNVNTGAITHVFKNNNFYILLNSQKLFILSGQGIVLEMPVEGFSTAGANDASVVLAKGHLLKGIDASQGCVILSPENYEKVGYIPVVVRGRSFGINGLPVVQLRFNKAEWINIGNKNEWSYTLDPNDFEFGLILIECGVNGKTFSSVVLERVEDLPKKRFVITFPDKIVEGQKTTFHVKDEFGNAVEDYVVLIGKSKYIRKVGSFTITFKSPGDYTLVFKKPGFEDKEIKVKVESKLPLIQIIAGIVILAGIYLILKKAKLLKGF